MRESMERWIKQVLLPLPSVSFLSQDESRELEEVKQKLTTKSLFLSLFPAVTLVYIPDQQSCRLSTFSPLSSLSEKLSGYRETPIIPPLSSVGHS